MQAKAARLEPARARRRSLPFVALAAGAIALSVNANDAESATGDNVVFILTDDQSANELSAMPNVQSLIGAKGATFRRGYVPYPLCCPSRASLLTGEYMHNHLVRGNVSPFGGWDAFRPQEANALPVWTKDAGYYNLHIGKYLNGYAAVPATPLPVPTAWDEWYGKISEGPLYFNYQLIEKTSPGDTPELEFYGDQAGEYQTDVLGDKAVEFVDGLTAAQSPFLMNLWFNAPTAPTTRRRATSGRSRPPSCRRFRPSTRRTSRTSRSGCASSRRSASRSGLRGRSPSSGAAASRCCAPLTNRSACWWPSSKARGSSTTPTSSSPQTTASSAASTGSPAASTWPTTPRPRSR